jgi:hypothetical protein
MSSWRICFSIMIILNITLKKPREREVLKILLQNGNLWHYHTQSGCRKPWTK